MTPKLYSILFSALLASTFVHEIRAKAAASPAFIPARIKRDLTPVKCPVCSSTPNIESITNASLSIVANVNASLLAIANETAGVALVLDIEANITALINTTSGATVLINLKTNSGVFLAVGVTANLSIEELLASLTDGLTPLLKKVGGVVFKLTSVPGVVLTLVNSILSELIGNIKATLQLNVNAGIQLVIAISINLSNLLNGVLEGLLELIGSDGLNVTGDLAGILNFLEGLGIIIGEAGGLVVLLEAGVDINLEALAGLTNGVEILITILVSINAKLDVGELLGSLLNNVESVLDLLIKLGNGLDTGVNGVFKILGAVIAFVEGDVSLDVLISRLLQFLGFNALAADVGDLSSELNQTLNDLLEAVKDLGLSETLSGLVELVQSLINGTLEINGCSISAILSTLLEGLATDVENLLETLVKVLLLLESIVSSATSLVQCLLVLILNINSPLGLELLKAIGIKLNLNNLTQIVGGILTSVLQLVPNLIQLLLTGNLYNVLAALPIIGDILKALNAAISAATNGKIDLKKLLNLNGLIKNLLLAVCQLLTGIRIGIGASVLAQVKAILQSCTSLNFYLNIKASVVIGVAL